MCVGGKSSFAILGGRVFAVQEYGRRACLCMAALSAARAIHGSSSSGPRGVGTPLALCSGCCGLWFTEYAASHQRTPVQCNDLQRGRVAERDRESKHATTRPPHPTHGSRNRMHWIIGWTKGAASPRENSRYGAHGGVVLTKIEDFFFF